MPACRSRLLLGAVLAVSSVASGCATGTPQVAATPSPAQTPRTSGPLADPDSPVRIVYDERLVSDPLPASSARRARADMSAEQAIRLGTAGGQSPEQQPGRPTASLRMVYPGDPDGARGAVGKPTWVLTWRDSAPAVRGPATMTDDERRAIADSLECVFVVTVDAAEARATNAVQLCEKK